MSTISMRVLKLSCVLFCVVFFVQTGLSQSTNKAENEETFLAILKSEAAPGDKAMACKSLAIFGSKKSVPDLSKLLADPKLSSWARTALEAIPGDEATAAIRQAATELKGRLQIGMVNSLGVRRDFEAVELLDQLLVSDDDEVAIASAIALGKIGNAPACESLQQRIAQTSGKVRSAVAEGCILCAEHVFKNGKRNKAIEIYDQVAGLDLPVQRIIEATRGAILCRDEQGIERLMQTLRSPDIKMFQLGLGLIREFPGKQLDSILADELQKTEASRAALLIQAMSDRPQTVNRAVVLAAAEQGDKRVRLSAIESLQRIGDESCLESLLRMAAGQDQELAMASRSSLTKLPGDNVDMEITNRLANANAQMLPVLFEIVGRRRIAAVQQVGKGLDHNQPSVRSAAVKALGEIVTFDDLPILIRQITQPTKPIDREVARQSLRTAAVRMPDTSRCVQTLAEAMKDANIDAQVTLLEVIGAVGGNDALAVLAKSAKSKETELQDVSSRLLGKWNNTDAAPILLDLAVTAPAEKFRIRSLRGYIGIVRKFPMPEPKRVGMCRQALRTASRITEKELVLEVLRVRPSQAGLKLAKECIAIPALAKKAITAANEITKKLAARRRK